MVTAHCWVEGHVGSCGGLGFGGTKCDEVLTWTDERLSDRGSVGKARIPANEDENTTASTASRKDGARKFAPIASDTQVSVPSRSTVSTMIKCNLRNILRCRSKQ